MPDWDAATYHRLSGPQLAWGRRVADRLAPSPGERILDLGCGTARLTRELAAQFPGVRFVGLDVSQAMLAEARLTDDGRVALVRAEGAALPFAPAFDAVFSAATFHWIPNHPRLFTQIHSALKPGGRLIAQCGGGPNLRQLLERTHALMDGPAFSRFFAGWRDPWHFAGVPDTERTLAAAGFTNVVVTLAPAPTTLPDARAYADFVSCVCVRHHVDTLPPGERGRFVAALAEAAAADDPPFTLDYWRLDIEARKARA